MMRIPTVIIILSVAQMAIDDRITEHVGTWARGELLPGGTREANIHTQ